MPAGPKLRGQLEAECNNPASRYWKCVRECTHALEQELRDLDWYADELIRTKIIGRVKTAERVLEKLDRHGAVKVKTLEEIERQVTDIVGASVVLDYLYHAEKMAARLESLSRWSVIKAVAVHQPTGYRAVRHIDVEMDLSPHDRMKAEIQVRTRLEEAWGIWSHPIYEVMRNRSLGPPPSEMVKQLAAISDSLRSADLEADMLRAEFEFWKEQLQ